MATTGSVQTQDKDTETAAAAVVVAKPKKKKKYSKNLRTPQELEVGATKAMRRIAKAVDKGLGIWIDARGKSARKKRNGAIRDSLRNSSKAMREVLATASKAPSDFVDSVADMKMTQRIFK